jgi:hypothetical protein
VIVPRFEVPALVVSTMPVEAKPVECAIGDVEIARLMQRLAGGFAIEDVEHAAMRDCGDSLPCLMLRHFVHGGFDALGEVVHAFACFEIIVEVACKVAGMCFGLADFAFCRSESLKDAEMSFAQLRQDFNFKAAPCCKHVGGVACTHQVAAVDGREVVVRGVERHRQGLGAASLVERDVDLALYALVDVPVGFAVADKADARGHDGGSVMLQGILHIRIQG